MSQEKISITDASFLEKLDAINTEYYEKQVEEYKDKRREIFGSTLSGKVKREELARYEGLINNSKNNEAMVSNLRKNIKEITLIINRLAEEELVDNSIRHYLYELVTAKKYMTNENMDSREILNLYNKEMEKVRKNRTKTHHKKIKQIDKMYDMNKKIEAVASKRITVEKSEKYENETVRIINLELTGNDNKQKFSETLYNELCKTPVLLSIDQSLHSLNQEEKKYIEKLGINHKILEEYYNKMIKNQNYSTKTAQIKTQLRPDVYEGKGYQIKEKLEDVNMLQKMVNERPYDFKIKSSSINELKKLLEEGMEVSVDLKITSIIQNAFKEASKKSKESYDVLVGLRGNLEKRLEELYRNANSIYNQLEINNVLHAGIELKRVEKPLTETIGDLNNNPADLSVDPETYEYKLVSRVKEKVETEKEQLLEESPYLNGKKEEEKTDILSLNSQVDHISQIRTTYYSDYIVYKRRNNDLSFIDYLKENVGYQASDLIRFEEKKQEILDKIYEEYKEYYSEERHFDINQFKFYCENSSKLIKELGGLNSVIKESDLDDYIENISKYKTTNKAELEEMLDDFEDSYTNNNSIRK